MQSVAVLRPHALIRRDPPVSLRVWRSYLPLLALLLLALAALGPIAQGWIQGAVQHELREQLHAAGFAWTQLTVSGQEVTLSGEEPASGAGGRALALARVATCATWMGRFSCATRVAGQFSSAAPGVSAAAAVAPTAAQACEHGLAASLGAEQIEFASGSATIAATSGPLLERLAQQVRACAGVIRIEGHTDTIGRGAFNRSLSAARAAAVRDALIARGVPAERLRAQGFGARRPIADNQTESGRARNRRIEFHVLSAN